MSEPPPYPQIEPTTFDLIAVGTGLAECIVAAAASASGKTVLHLDTNPFYGSHYSSLSVPELTSFLISNSTASSPPSSTSTTTDIPDYSIVNLITQPVYSDVEISCFYPELMEENLRKFNLDLCGPRVLFCADKSIDLMLKSGASNYVEFKSIDASFVGDGNGKLWNVPDSRAAIFKDKSLTLMEKNQLMRFFKLVQGHLVATVGSGTSGNGNGNDEEEGETKISDEDLQRPFVEYLSKMRLPPKIRLIILYAIAMADYDQDDMGVCQNLLKTKDGIDRLALYQSSVGRFTNASGALIYPIYGQGELPQAFSRRSAVKGCIYVLRMPVTALLMEKDSGSYKGIRLASGQDIFSQKLVLDPSFTLASPSASPSDLLHESFNFLSTRDVKGKVARGICITRNSLKPDMSNLLVVYPPRSLYPEQITSIRALQISGNLAVCPLGMFVLYLSALCDDAIQGKRLLNAAMNALLTFPDPVNSESSSTVQSETTEEKPSVIWSGLYMQEMSTGQFDSINFAPMPDENLNYNDILDAALKLFQEMYPNEENFPETTPPENSEDDIGLTLET
ncbi:rab escort protein 1-like [Populus nigra]|uniref:rab escort protein 1-like n=1 Tax=Populus nigra TaxID=3691 RepID=UPI002B265155|nr:rab escort protein 1-like [Populus nigra]XP_061972700.1 rab escort protein 1-like [Populus nigra]